MSTDHPDLTFSCPNCGNEFVWEARYAGRRLSCPCGQVVVGPTRQQVLAAAAPPEEAPAPQPQPRAETLASIYGAPRRRIVEDDDERPGWAKNVLIPSILL